MALPTVLFRSRQSLVWLCTCYTKASASEQAAFHVLLGEIGASVEQFERILAELCFCCGTIPRTPPSGGGGGGGTVPGPEPKPEPEPEPEPQPEPDKPTQPAPGLIECIKKVIAKMCAIGPSRIREIATALRLFGTSMADGPTKTLVLAVAAGMDRIADMCDQPSTVLASDVRGFCFCYDAVLKLKNEGLLGLIIGSSSEMDAFTSAIAECCAFPEAKNAPMPPWLAAIVPDKVQMRR